MPELLVWPPTVTVSGDSPAVKPAGYVPPGEIQIGKFLNAAINFVIQAAVIYFLIVLPMQKLLKMRFRTSSAVVWPVKASSAQSAR